MRYIIIILFLFISSIANSDELELNCKFDNYYAINRTYSQNLIKSWAPQIQTHIIKSDKTAYWNEVRIEGKVKVNDSKKVKFSYELKRKYITRWHLVYFKSTKKANIDMNSQVIIFNLALFGGLVKHQEIIERQLKTQIQIMKA